MNWKTFDLSGVAWSAMYCGMKEAVFCAGWELGVTFATSCNA